MCTKCPLCANMMHAHYIQMTRKFQCTSPDQIPFVMVTHIPPNPGSVPETASFTNWIFRSKASCHTPVIQALESLRQENLDFKASLGYTGKHRPM